MWVQEREGGRVYLRNSVNANCLMLFDSGLDGLVLKLSGRLLGPLINFSSALTYTLQVQLFASGKSCLTLKREKSIHFGLSNMIPRI